MDGNLSTPGEIPARQETQFRVKTFLIQPQSRRIYIEIERGYVVDNIFQATMRDSCELLDTDAILDAETQKVVTPAVIEYTTFVNKALKDRIRKALVAKNLI